jgi:hypothetical protein
MTELYGCFVYINFSVITSVLCCQMIIPYDAVEIFIVSVQFSCSKCTAQKLHSYWFQIQGTNDFNTVSKYSMAKNGYFRDDYMCHFVTKWSQRTPLIHLGYYMRVLTVDFTLRSFLDATSGQPTQVFRREIFQNIVCPYLSCSCSKLSMWSQICFNFILGRYSV